MNADEDCYTRGLYSALIDRNGTGMADSEQMPLWGLYLATKPCVALGTWVGLLGRAGTDKMLPRH